MLLQDVMLAEPKQVVNEMDKNSVPGPDDFLGSFFINCWGIIAIDMLQAMREFI